MVIRSEDIVKLTIYLEADSNFSEIENGENLFRIPYQGSESYILSYRMIKKILMCFAVPLNVTAIYIIYLGHEHIVTYSLQCHHKNIPQSCSTAIKCCVNHIQCYFSTT